MAVAVVGGVIFSTVLTLFVVPALYSLLDSIFGKRSKSAGHERAAAKEIADLDAHGLGLTPDAAPDAAPHGPA